VGTWHVLSLYRCDALRNLIEVIQEYDIDLLAIQEVRWLGKNILEKKNCTVYYTFSDKQHYLGTGFIVNNHIRILVIDFKPIDIKICALRIKGIFQNYSFICVHSPTEEKSEREKDQFDKSLERAVPFIRYKDYFK
jgi:exonuclease III